MDDRSDRRIITFLFTDVVGSTALAERLPDLAGDALTTQHEIVVAAVEEHGGSVFERIGDGAYAAFDDPLAAVASAARVQQGIAAHDWGPIGLLQLRVALDRGEVERRGDRYFGTALFRCSRLLDLARAGEILLTAGVAALVADALPAEHRLRDMGE